MSVLAELIQVQLAMLNLQHHVMERLKCVISQAENQLQVHI